MFQMVDVTAVIPTFNGQRFLGVVLAALARQSLKGDRYEVVVVDNNSTVDLFAGPGTADALAALRSKGVSFRCIREPRQGLTYARIAGVLAAYGSAVCYLDDDNEPGSEYLEVGMRALADQPKVGVLVSRVFPLYTVMPSPAVRRREHLFAVNHMLGDTPIRWPAETVTCPTLGAGMWVRRSVMEQILERFGTGVLPDRVGTTLVSGGDIELGILAGRVGYDRLYVPGLTLHHHIPAGRVQSEYLARLIDGIVRSAATIDAHYLGRRPSVLTRVGGFAVTIAFGWLQALRRGDAGREYRFMIAASRARLRGHY